MLSSMQAQVSSVERRVSRGGTSFLDTRGPAPGRRLARGPGRSGQGPAGKPGALKPSRQAGAPLGPGLPAQGPPQTTRARGNCSAKGHRQASIHRHNESRFQRSEWSLANKPRALPWAGMNDAVGVSNRPAVPAGWLPVGECCPTHRRGTDVKPRECPNSRAGFPSPRPSPQGRGRTRAGTRTSLHRRIRRPANVRKCAEMCGKKKIK